MYGRIEFLEYMTYSFLVDLNGKVYMGLVIMAALRFHIGANYMNDF